MVQQHELESKWETNYLRYIWVDRCVRHAFLSLVNATADVYSGVKLTFFLSGEWGGSAGSGAPHSGGGLTELRNGSDHDCAA